MVGDYKTGTGPANVTKEIIKGLNKTAFAQLFTGKLMRLVELFVRMPFCDVCLMSGYSAQNLYAIKFARLFNKKCIYLMHGCVEHENEINGAVDDRMNAVERGTLLGCDLVLAVSEQFEDWLKCNYPEYKNKISHLTNGVSYEMFGTAREKKDKKCLKQDDCYKIISVGGGMPRKRIRVICDAIGLLVKEGLKVRLVVAGAVGKDSDYINSFDFVDNRGLISSEELAKAYRECDLFIQNSCFETFGLAPVEALVSGIDVLLSTNVGALSLISKEALSEMDLIENCDDPNEIAEKIKGIMNSSNNERLLSGIDKENTSWESVCARLQDILKTI